MQRGFRVPGEKPFLPIGIAIVAITVVALVYGITTQTGGGSGVQGPPEAALAEVRPSGSQLQANTGELTAVEVVVVNTGPVKHTFGVTLSFRPPAGGAAVDLPPKDVRLSPGEEKAVEWEYTYEAAGPWDLRAAVWRESTEPLTTLLDDTDWVTGYVMVTAVIPKAPVIASLGCVPAAVEPGDRVTCKPSIEGNVTSWAWTGGGLPPAGDESTYATTYDAQGANTISLTACNIGVCSAASTTIDVGPPALVVEPTPRRTPTRVPTVAPRPTQEPTPVPPPTEEPTPTVVEPTPPTEEPTPPPPPPEVPVVTISVDRGEGAAYLVGDSISICYTVSGPMDVTIVDVAADGGERWRYNAFDGGTGACAASVVDLPTGREELQIYGPTYSCGPDCEAQASATTFYFVELPPGAPPPPTPIPAVGGIQGTVYCGRPGSCVLPSAVRLVNASNSQVIAEAVPDSAGGYQFANVAPGTYLLQPISDRYASCPVVSVTIAAVAPVRVDIDVSACTLR